MRLTSRHVQPEVTTAGREEVGFTTGRSQTLNKNSFPDVWEDGCFLCLLWVVAFFQFD